MTDAAQAGAPPDAPEPPALTPLARIRAIMGGAAGNLVEW